MSNYLLCSSNSLENSLNQSSLKRLPCVSLISYKYFWNKDSRSATSVVSLEVLYSYNLMKRVPKNYCDRKLVIFHLNGLTISIILCFSIIFFNFYKILEWLTAWYHTVSTLYIHIVFQRNCYRQFFSILSNMFIVSW